MRMKTSTDTSLYHRRLAVTAAVLLVYVAGLLANDSWQLYDDSQVAVVEITVDQADMTWIYQNVYSDSLHPATVHFTNAWIDSTIDSVGFRLRGNTSRTSWKKSFKLSFNTFVPGRQFYGVDKLNLNGEHNDPSIVRSKLCWDLFQDIGMTSTRAAHAAVYINGDYYGLYISVEHVDDEFIQTNYVDDSGNLWKCLWPADLTYLGEDPNLYKSIDDGNGRQAYDLKTNRQLDDYSQLARLIDIINNTPGDQFDDSLESILAVPEVLKYLAVNTLVGGWDDYRSLRNNYYLYFEPALGKFHWIPYDYDNTFGIDWFDTDWANADPYIYPRAANDAGGRPLSDRIMAHPRYSNLYSHFLQYYNNHVFVLDDIMNRLVNIKTLITPRAEADKYRTKDYQFTMDDFHDSYDAAGYERDHVKYSISDFVTHRSTSLPGMLLEWFSEPSVYHIDWWPENPLPDDTIHIAAAAFSQVSLTEVTILCQSGDLAVIDSIPMVFQPVADTKLVEEADRWLGVIPPLGSGGSGHFRIAASDVYGSAGYGPLNGTIPIRTPQVISDHLVINEFLASNQSVNADDAGEFDDWVELYNPTPQEILLDGMYLTDDSGLLTKWRFPDNLVLNPSDYLLVWCDNDAGQAGLHAFFKLNAGGEYLALVADDGATIIDFVSFGTQTTDISFGRYPDASDNWASLTPTPGDGNIILMVKDMAVPTDFLIAVYPNPFNAAATIDFTLPQPMAVSLKVYDLLGREVVTLHQGWQDAGYHNVVWEGKDRSGQAVASGIYFAVIQTENTVRSVKMLLLK